MGKKRTFGGTQKFLADGVAEGSKNRPGGNFGHVAHSTSRNFNFNEKQKSYVSWKLSNAKKSKIMVAPPPLWHSMSVFSRFVLRWEVSTRDKWNFTKKFFQPHGLKEFFSKSKPYLKSNVTTLKKYFFLDFFEL